MHRCVRVHRCTMSQQCKEEGEPRRPSSVTVRNCVASIFSGGEIDIDALCERKGIALYVDMNINPAVVRRRVPGVLLSMGASSISRAMAASIVSRCIARTRFIM
jgi:hypothetical protein